MGLIKNILDGWMDKYMKRLSLVELEPLNHSFWEGHMVQPYRFRRRVEAEDAVGSHVSPETPLPHLTCNPAAKELQSKGNAQMPRLRADPDEPS